MNIVSKADTDGWIEDSFTPKYKDYSISFKKYEATIYIDQQPTDYKLEFSWFTKSMNVRVLELAGQDVESFHVVLIGKEKVNLDLIFGDFCDPKEAFIFLLKQAKIMIKNYHSLDSQKV